MEPAIASNPVIFGPKYQKFNEAEQILKSGGGFCVQNSESIERIFSELLNSRDLLKKSGEASLNLITSNIGASDLVRDKIGFFNDKMSEVDNDKAVKNFFSPEFRNRLDNVIHFKMLNQENCLKIVDKFLIELVSLIIDKDLILSVSDLAKKKLL